MNPSSFLFWKEVFSEHIDYGKENSPNIFDIERKNLWIWKENSPSFFYFGKRYSSNILIMEKKILRTFWILKEKIFKDIDNEKKILQVFLKWNDVFQFKKSSKILIMEKKILRTFWILKEKFFEYIDCSSSFFILEWGLSI